MPIRIANGTSQTQDWLYCWEDGVEWIREKEDISIKENSYGTMRFADMFGAYNKAMYPSSMVCHLAGVRTEESPVRALGLTNYATYKWATWGKVENKKLGHYTFYPIYDWSYTDVWKSINSNGWEYTKVYDYQYQYGIPVLEMRVSNLHHETAICNLFYMQDVEPETFNAIVSRIKGINTAGMLGKSQFNQIPKELPHMFSSWREYRDYLLQHLIIDADNRGKLDKQFRVMQQMFDEDRYFNVTEDQMYKTQIKTILVNDVHLTKLLGWDKAHGIHRSGWGKKEYNKRGEWTQFKFKG